MVLAVMIARFLLRKRPKIYSYILWSLVAFRLLVPVSVSTSFSFFNLSTVPDMRLEPVVENTDRISDGTTESETIKEPSNTELPFAQSNPRQTAKQAERQKIEKQDPQIEEPIGDLSEIAAIIWLFGVGVLLLYTLFKVIGMRKQFASAVLWQDNIYEADGIKSPFVFSILRPRIYVPFSLEEVERDYILRHEKEHIRRGDHLVKYAAYMLAIAYWFHPLVWMAYYFMCQDMEMSCDEKVIRGLDGEKRKDYSRILLSFATEKRQFVGPLYFGENNVEKRITNILKSKKGGIAAAVLGVVLIGALILFFATDAKKATGENVRTGIDIDLESKMEAGVAIELPDQPQIREKVDNAATSDTESESDYSYVYENVINIEEVRESWDDFYLERRSFGHEYEVEDRVTDDYIPKEIIDVLTALNNGNWDEEPFAETYKNYLADDDISIDTYLEGGYIHIDPDDIDKIAEFADLDDLYFLDVFNVSGIMLVDIDYDNEKECIAETYNDRNGATWFHIYDTKDGEVEEVYRIGPEPGVGKTELLKIDGKYFMLTNSYMGFYDPRNGSWTEVSVERNATAYTSHEFYSNTQLEDEKFLEGIDLMDAKDSWKKQEKDFFGFYDSAHDPNNLYKPRVMEQKIEGEIYYYVLSDFSYHCRNDEYDRILFVIKEADNDKFEIVKAYYLVADLQLEIS
ncbi:MAG: hypothetical protein J1E61_08350 [Lachnospiraceae bacterium]|nr:hypothetical protein [Lachnospiraceae bacterium]